MRKPTPLAPILAARINEAMALHPTVKNQSQLALAAGLAQSSVNAILRGAADPSMGVLYSIANGLGIGVDALVKDVPVLPSHMPRSSTDTDLERLAPLQRALVEVVLHAAKAGQLPDAECAKLIGDWAGRIEPRAASRDAA
jgi:transcriptional regulator with XRE-family HTH domain